MNKKIKDYVIIVLPDESKIELRKSIDGKELNYYERLDELFNKLPILESYAIVKGDIRTESGNIEGALNYFETYWLGKKNVNGRWTEKIKNCLDYITTYLLKAEDE